MLYRIPKLEGEVLIKIRINSNEYFFYLHRGYEPYNYQDAFHLNLVDYEISDKIKEILNNTLPGNLLRYRTITVQFRSIIIHFQP